MSKKNHPNRLPAYTKVTLSSLAAASAVGTTDAAVIYFDVNPDRVLVGSSFGYAIFGNINLLTGTYTSGSFDGNYFAIGMDLGGDLFSGHYSGNLEWGLSSTDYSGTTPFQPTRVQKLASGTPISDISPSIGSWGQTGPYMSYNGTGPWVGGGDAYAPLRISAGGTNYNYGWVNINFTDNGDGTSSSTITGFAFEDQINTPIEAGAIPEPSTYALLALAGLFGAAVWHQRRHQRGAAPALLQLAAGARGVAQLRADRKS